MLVVSGNAPFTPRSCQTSADPSKTSQLDLGGATPRHVVVVECVNVAV
jgi:hypothetical protein